MGAIAAVAAGCGGSSEISPEQVASIKTQAKRELQAEQRQRDADRKLRELERQVRELRKKSKPGKKREVGSAAPAPPGSPGGNSGSACGGGISVNSVTSCSFAANVAAAFYDSGAGTVYATSPVTGQTYAMSCRSGVPTVCTGGNGAAVYIR
ncbi:hypothetical protein VSS74_06760 [Conexibacter stalactiti]|uniref:Secreted protein n=1 Tax=Conexibacter stalactiti TaxID=1940611 RepID=A0ABU4HL79_9ACTN|nr:hypothetical protein [Conexibacter stalactiti]MDW5594027.1 hypothetical protein [Conexibacter stalactiti]MEC5034669.1 hypothetical protein [Conexibacter stalactiti]